MLKHADTKEGQKKKIPVRAITGRTMWQCAWMWWCSKFCGFAKRGPRYGDKSTSVHARIDPGIIEHRAIPVAPVARRKVNYLPRDYTKGYDMIVRYTASKRTLSDVTFVRDTFWPLLSRSNIRGRRQNTLCNIIDQLIIYIYLDTIFRKRIFLPSDISRMRASTREMCRCAVYRSLGKFWSRTVGEKSSLLYREI